MSSQSSSQSMLPPLPSPPDYNRRRSTAEPGKGKASTRAKVRARLPRPRSAARSALVQKLTPADAEWLLDMPHKTQGPSLCPARRDHR